MKMSTDYDAVVEVSYCTFTYYLLVLYISPELDIDSCLIALSTVYKITIENRLIKTSQDCIPSRG